VLVLAVVSLGVPLALSLRDRVNAEVHSQALSQADVVAASSADLINPARTAELNALVRSGGASVRGRVLIVDARGRVLADSAGPGTLGSSYANRPELATALRGRAVQTQRASRSLGENILATAVPILRSGSTIGAVRVKVSRREGRVMNATPEFDDCAALAAAHNLPVKEVQAIVVNAYGARTP